MVNVHVRKKRGKKIRREFQKFQNVRGVNIEVGLVSAYTDEFASGRLEGKRDLRVTALGPKIHLSH